MSFFPGNFDDPVMVWFVSNDSAVVALDASRHRIGPLSELIAPSRFSAECASVTR
jgi:hypothetical protein